MYEQTISIRIVCRAFFPHRGRQRCTLRHVLLPLYNIHPLFTMCLLIGDDGTISDFTQTRNNNLWITLRVVPCGNRTRHTLRSSKLPSHPEIQICTEFEVGVTVIA
ncbi:hypothetical protein SFRURICE_018668 [Spodoptera frugiperda]|nr:hypothetical protein SFRURICE_018668 [Spodoptera frugiperda]